MAALRIVPSGAEDDDGDDAPKRTAASRVLALLGAFSRGGGSLTLSEISRYADLSLTTTHRLAREVLEWGGLELDDTGHYRLSTKILELASSSTQALRLRERALPHLVDLHRRTGLTVHLSVRDGRNVMYLEALRAHPNYSGANRIGGRLPLHVTATGLALLAYAPEHEIDDYLAEPLKRYTDSTITDPVSLRSYLASVRQTRFAVAEGFMTPRVGVVAAPVIGADGAVETAVGAVHLLDEHDPHRLVEVVLATAARISRSLADTKSPPDPRTIDFNRRQAGLL